MAHSHIDIDPALPLGRQADKGHDRWHPDIAPMVRIALINMIDYIADACSRLREQAYCLASVAVDLRISQVVDVPNMTVSAVLPLGIFARQPA